MAILSNKETRTISFVSSPEDIFDYFEEKNFSFSREIITRYFLSLKTKPFVILTGISGTGKTKIAQLFAEYICQKEPVEERRKRMAFVSVRPDWMDNKGLLGFYNLLDEKYYDTPLLRLVLEAQKNPSKTYFAILDEMNLSKVEMYFSDFLSIMESRTVNNEKGEKIQLHNRSEAKTLDGATIPGAISIPPNVYFTGTVNVDETTYMFSPKVLDRANVLEFNEVDLDDYAVSTQQTDKFHLANPEVLEKFSNATRSPFCSKDDFNELNSVSSESTGFIKDLLVRLKKYNLHFGYRVVNEISRFISLASEHLDDIFSADKAFDIQMLQKVLPKFHGTQAKLELPLKDILSFCYENESEINSAVIEKAMSFDEEARFPRTAQKTARMLTNLQIQGYASFIE